MGWPLLAKPERARERRNPPYFPPYPAYTQSLFQSGVNPLFRHYTPIACNAVVIACIAFACSLIPYTYTLIFLLIHCLLYPYVSGYRQVFAGHMRNGTTKGFQADYTQSHQPATYSPYAPNTARLTASQATFITTK